MTHTTKEFKNELNERISLAIDLKHMFSLGTKDLSEYDSKVIVYSYNDPEDYYEFDDLTDAIDSTLADLKRAVIWTIENLPENPSTRNLRQYTDLGYLLFDAISMAQHLEELALDSNIDISEDGNYYYTSTFRGRRNNFEYSMYDVGGMVGQIIRLFNNREFY